MASQTRVELIETSRGGYSLIYKGYKFRKTKNRDRKTDFKCTLELCKARVTLIDGDKIYCDKNAVHTHSATPVAIESSRFKERIKSKLRKEPLKTMPQIYNAVRTDFLRQSGDEEAAAVREAATVSYNSIKSTIYREKRKIFPSQPAHRKDIKLEGEWSETIDQRNFLLCDDGQEDRIIIFGTDTVLRKVCDANTLFMDGTFKSVPELFSQLYTIHCEINGVMFPCLFALLPDKKSSTYVKMFDLIEAKASLLNLTFAPKKFQLDFEISMLNAISVKFPTASRIGCFFHYTQAIYRKVVDIGLRPEYNNVPGDPEIKKLVRRLSALPLVKPEELDNVWELIYETKPSHNSKVDALLNYFVETWLDDLDARFDRTIWNHWGNCGKRTTNNMEGWHHALNKRAGRIHPNIFELIKVLKEEEVKVVDDLKLLRNGRIIRRRDPTYSQLDKRLVELKLRVENSDLTWIEYLDAASHLVKHCA